jgi:hypothetical protein
MPNRIMIMSGRKQSGKTTAASYIASCYINSKSPGLTKIDKLGRIRVADDAVYDPEKAYKGQCPIFHDYNIRIYSFADYMKKCIMDLFDIPPERLWGADKYKNLGSGIMWESISAEIRQKYANPDKKKSVLMATGELTCRELMEVYGTHIHRELDYNCWARATYAKIRDEQYSLSIITDARYPNEISMGAEIGAISFRFLRNPFNATSAPESALDEFPLGEFTNVIDNVDMTFSEKNKALHKVVSRHFTAEPVEVLETEDED